MIEPECSVESTNYLAPLRLRIKNKHYVAPIRIQYQLPGAGTYRVTEACYGGRGNTKLPLFCLPSDNV